MNVLKSQSLKGFRNDHIYTALKVDITSSKLVYICLPIATQESHILHVVLKTT